MAPAHSGLGDSRPTLQRTLVHLWEPHGEGCWHRFWHGVPTSAWASHPEIPFSQSEALPAGSPLWEPFGKVTSPFVWTSPRPAMTSLFSSTLQPGTSPSHAPGLGPGVEEELPECLLEEQTWQFYLDQSRLQARKTDCSDIKWNTKEL